MLTDRALPQQLAAMAQLHRECFGQEAWSEAQIAGSLSLDTTMVRLWLEEGQVVAFLLAQKTGQEAEILTLCTHPAWRRKGLSGALIDALWGSLPKREGAVLFLEVAAGNAPAISLYEKRGFKLFGRRPAYYGQGDNRWDALTYRLEEGAFAPQDLHRPARHGSTCGDT